MAERGAPVKGRTVADVGHYNPHTDAFVVEKDKVAEWLKQGVTASPTVYNLLIEHKIITGEKVTSWKPKKKAADPAAPAATPAPQVGEQPAAT